MKAFSLAAGSQFWNCDRVVMIHDRSDLRHAVRIERTAKR